MFFRQGAIGVGRRLEMGWAVLLLLTDTGHLTDTFD